MRKYLYLFLLRQTEAYPMKCWHWWIENSTSSVFLCSLSMRTFDTFPDALMIGSQNTNGKFTTCPMMCRRGNTKWTSTHGAALMIGPEQTNSTANGCGRRRSTLGTRSLPTGVLTHLPGSMTSRAGQATWFSALETETHQITLNKISGVG